MFTFFSSPSVVTLALAGSASRAAESSDCASRLPGSAIESEFQIAGHVFMAGIDAGFVRQAGQLGSESVVERVRMAAAVAVAGACVEKRVPAEQARLWGMCQQADVGHRVAGRVQALQLHGSANADDVALRQPAIHPADGWRRRRVPAPSRESPLRGPRCRRYGHGAHGY